MSGLQDYQLYARPSFFEGIGRTLDFWGIFNIYRISRTPEEADAKAMRADWSAVGNTLNSIISDIEKKGIVNEQKGESE